MKMDGVKHGTGAFYSPSAAARKACCHSNCAPLGRAMESEAESSVYKKLAQFTLPLLTHLIKQSLLSVTTNILCHTFPAEEPLALVVTVDPLLISFTHDFKSYNFIFYFHGLYRYPIVISTALGKFYDFACIVFPSTENVCVWRVTFVMFMIH